MIVESNDKINECNSGKRDTEVLLEALEKCKKLEYEKALLYKNYRDLEKAFNDLLADNQELIRKISEIKQCF